MKGTWNLDPIYLGFDDPAFEADMAALKEAVEAVGAHAAALETAQPLEGLRKGIALEEKISALAERLILFASLRQSADAKDADAGSRMGQLMAILSATAAPEAAFKDWAAKLPDLMELVEGDEKLKDYAFLFANMQESSRHLLPGRGEEIMAKMGLSGGDAWSDMQSYLTST